MSMRIILQRGMRFSNEYNNIFIPESPALGPQYHQYRLCQEGLVKHAITKPSIPSFIVGKCVVVKEIMTKKIAQVWRLSVLCSFFLREIKSTNFPAPPVQWRSLHDRCHDFFVIHIYGPSECFSESLSNTCLTDCVYFYMHLICTWSYPYLRK